jgi:hypothetical protein
VRRSFKVGERVSRPIGTGADPSAPYPVVVSSSPRASWPHTQSFLFLRPPWGAAREDAAEHHRGEAAARGGCCRRAPPAGRSSPGSTITGMPPQGRSPPLSTSVRSRCAEEGRKGEPVVVQARSREGRRRASTQQQQGNPTPLSTYPGGLRRRAQGPALARSDEPRTS